MTGTKPQTRSVIVERDIPHPPEKIWRALTQPELISEWLMKTDFKPMMDNRFTLAGDWGSVNCQVTELDPPNSLAYTWVAFGLESTVTWTLSPSASGTHLRMEQAGFRTDQEQFYSGAAQSWPTFVAKLEEVAGRL